MNVLDLLKHAALVSGDLAQKQEALRRNGERLASAEARCRERILDVSADMAELLAHMERVYWDSGVCVSGPAGGAGGGDAEGLSRTTLESILAAIVEPSAHRHDQSAQL